MAGSSTSDNASGSGVRLNMLPVVFPEGTQKDVLYRLERTDELWEDIKRRARGGQAFHAYRHRDRIYVWAHSGQQMPDDLDLSNAVELLPSGDLVPSAVVAYAVREAVVDRLIDHLGFERVGATVEGQVRLFRRRVNLAAQALAPLADAAGKEIGPETGTFPYLAVQPMPFGDRDRSGPVALVLDAGVVNRLDIPLADLAQAGIDLNGMPVVWSHADECRLPKRALTGGRPPFRHSAIRRTRARNWCGNRVLRASASRLRYMPKKPTDTKVARRFAELVGLGLSQAEAARATQIGVRTGERLLTQPEYRAIVEKTR